MKRVVWLVLFLALMTPALSAAPAQAEESGNWSKRWEIDISSTLHNPHQPAVPHSGPDGTLYFLTNYNSTYSKTDYKLTSISPAGRLNWTYPFSTKSNIWNHVIVSTPGDGNVYIIDYSPIGSPYMIHKIGANGKLIKKIYLPAPNKPQREEWNFVHIKVNADSTITVAGEDQKNHNMFMYLMNQAGKVIWKKTLKKSDLPYPVSVTLTDDNLLLVPQKDHVEVYSYAGKLLFQLAKNKDEDFQLFRTQDGNYVGRASFYSDNPQARLVGIGKDGKVKWTKKLDAGGIVYQFKNQMYYTITVPGQYYDASAVIMFNPQDGKEITRHDADKYFEINNNPNRGLFREDRDYRNDPYISLSNAIPSARDPKRVDTQDLLLDPADFSLFQDVTAMRDSRKTGFYDFVLQGTKDKPYLIGWSKEKIYRYDFKN
jgi:hypothetical protein